MSPQFKPGEVKTAKVVMRNPTAKAFNYHAMLYMGVVQVAMAEADFRLNPGESKEISFSITMPMQTGVYPVYISVFSEGNLLAHYRATEDITIITLPPGAIPFTCTFTVNNLPDWAKSWHIYFASYNPNLPGSEYYYSSEVLVGQSITLRGNTYDVWQARAYNMLYVVASNAEPGYGTYYLQKNIQPFTPEDGAKYRIDYGGGGWADPATITKMA